MADSESRTKEEIARDMERTRQHLTHTVLVAKDYVVRRNAGVRAVKATKQAYKNTKKRVVAVSNRVKDGAAAVVDKARETDRNIRSNPYRTVGLGLLAGVLFGFLMTRKPRKNKR